MHSLVVKLIACLLAGLAAVLVWLDSASLQVMRENLEATAVVTGHRLVDTIFRSARDHMLEDQREQVAQILSSIGLQEGIRKIRIIAHNGVVHFSKDPREIGEVVDRGAGSCLGCHAAAKPLEKPQTKVTVRIYHSGQERVIGLIRPIENEAACSNAACHAHPVSQSTLGVLEVCVSLNSVDENLKTYERRMRSRVVASAAVLLPLVGFVVWFFVGHPIRRLIAGVGILAARNLKFRFRLHRRDEIGKLSDAFDRMAGELDAATQDLEARIRELVEARDKAEEGARLKSEFLANMSHEIRTPLNGVLGMTAVALNTELTPEQRGYLEIARSSGESLLSLINDILDFSKIEAGKLDLESLAFNLHDCLEPTMKALGVRAFERGLELTYAVGATVPETLLGDPGRLLQVLNNLVGNAIKFTERGEVCIEVAPESSCGGQVSLHFAIRDTGIGISKEQQARIWEAFSQADGSMTRRYGGTGLGLTISSRLVRLMGGRIWLESVPGQGSTFHCTAMFGVANAGSRPAPQDAALGGRTVLVVDDNPTNRRVLEEQLSGWGMQPVLAADAEAALDLLTHSADGGHPLALALIDAQMPGTDGLALIAGIRKDARLAATPIIVLTSAGVAGDAEHSRGLDVVACLIKPVGRSELRTAILRALNPDRSATPSALAVNPDPEPHSALHILLAEDNAVNSMVAVRVLEKRGYRVTTAANGREALDQLVRRSFDLVLMDCQMPEMDGFEATAAIRQREKTTGCHLPIIAVTANAMQGDAERCLAAGMDAYLSKPLKPTTMFQTIEQVVATATSLL